MGGVPGYGRVEPEADEPVFHSEWEGRVFGLVVSVKDGLSRPRLESLDPDEYLSGYYQRWMIALERGLIDRGVLSADELEAKTEYFRNHPRADPTRNVDPEQTERVRTDMYRQHQHRRTPARPPAYVVGYRVRARRSQHGGHTRMPGYVHGKRGVIRAFYAAYAVPDENPGTRLLPEQHLYSVRLRRPRVVGAGGGGRARPCISTCGRAISSRSIQPAPN